MQELYIIAIRPCYVEKERRIFTPYAKATDGSLFPHQNNNEKGNSVHRIFINNLGGSFNKLIADKIIDFIFASITLSLYLSLSVYLILF